MSTIHPHWQTADDDASPRPRSAAPQMKPKEKESVHVAIVPASRMPAAVVGIVTFAVLGFTLAGGWQAMTAQVTPPSGGSSASSAASSMTTLKIRITSNGFQPANATAKPGQKITWTNDQSIPHILTSQTLRDNSGSYLNTPAIFPGGNVTFQVGETEPDREHTITSTTDETLIGTVTVSAAGASSSAAKSSKMPLGSLDDVKLPSGKGTSSSKKSIGKPVAVKKKASSSGKSVAALGNSSAGSVAAVTAVSSAESSSADAVAMHSSPAETSSAISAGSDSGYASAPTGTTLDTYAPTPAVQPEPVYAPTPVPAVPAPVVYQQPLIGSVAENNYAPPSPQPLEGPHTGPGLWVVCAMSVATLWYGTRKYFMRPENVRA